MLYKMAVFVLFSFVVRLRPQGGALRGQVEMIFSIHFHNLSENRKKFIITVIKTLTRSNACNAYENSTR
jgi:hypothetical protein